MPHPEVDPWITQNPYIIEVRRYSEVNTDTQRRCYNGCYAKSEIMAGPWEIMERVKTLDKAKERLVFWGELNDYAVSQRGPSAKAEYRVTHLNASSQS